MRLQNSFYNHLSALGFHIFGTLLMIATLFYLRFEPDFVFIFLIFWSGYTIPVIYLHGEYYLQNKDEIYEIYPNQITLHKTDADKTYSNNELNKIFVYKSASMDAWGIPFLSIEFYYYARIITNSGEELIITRLLTPKVEEAVRQLEGVPVERIKRVFCPIFWK